jgi:hypothetical protein
MFSRVILEECFDVTDTETGVDTAATATGDEVEAADSSSETK